MNRISTTSTRTTRLQAASAAALVALTALTAAAWMTVAPRSHGPEVIKLERVVIEGRRAPDTVTTAGIQTLPRVIVTGRRDASADGAQVASVCVAPAVC